MTARRPNLALVREGNPGHQPKERLEKGVRFPPAAPPEPVWLERFPPARPRKVAKELVDGERARSRLVTEVNRRCRLVASDRWRLVVPALDAIGLLARVDAEVLLDYCTCVARVDQAERQISREGLTIQGERGWQRNGAAILAQGYRTRLKHLEIQLGLTPLARDSLTGTTGGATGDDVDEDSPWDV